MSSPDAFTGSIPALYDRYLGPVLFEPYAADLVARLPKRDGLRVLELACGTGIVTRRLREALPGSATLTVTDLNEAMVDYARAAVAADAIVWQQADAQALGFDDAVIRRRRLPVRLHVPAGQGAGIPGGSPSARHRRCAARERLAFAGRQSSAGRHPHALAELYPDDPPRFLETPYGYHDTDRIRADMSAAGWETCSWKTSAFKASVTRPLTFAAGFALGTPLTHELAERGADIDPVRDVLTAALIPFGGDTPFEPLLAATVISATPPSGA